MVEIIARCGGIFKFSHVKDVCNPKALHQYLQGQKQLTPLVKKWRGLGEYIYILPRKLTEPYWNLGTQINDYKVYRSLALIGYYVAQANLIMAPEERRRLLPDYPQRAFNGVYYCEDSFDLKTNVVVVDFYKPEAKIYKILEYFHEEMEHKKTPRYHIITNKNRAELLNKINNKYPKLTVEVFQNEKLLNIL